ncbi:hypothetical protein GCM10017322_37930 [Paracoccus aerius]|nr:hypothetical protein GCM10017322_37930 [Paracoccus aerius]
MDTLRQHAWSLWNWIAVHGQWIFSGIGVTVLLGFFALFGRKNQRDGTKQSKDAESISTAPASRLITEITDRERVNYDPALGRVLRSASQEAKYQRRASPKRALRKRGATTPGAALLLALLALLALALVTCSTS